MPGRGTPVTACGLSMGTAKLHFITSGHQVRLRLSKPPQITYLRTLSLDRSIERGKEDCSCQIGIAYLVEHGTWKMRISQKGLRRPICDLRRRKEETRTPLLPSTAHDNAICMARSYLRVINNRFYLRIF